MPKLTLKSRLANFWRILPFAPEDERLFQREYFVKRRPVIIAGVWVMVALWLLMTSVEFLTSRTPLYVIFGMVVGNILLLWIALRPKFAERWQLVLTVATSFLLIWPLTTYSIGLLAGAGIFIYMFVAVLRILPLQFRWTMIQVFVIVASLSYLSGFTSPGKWDGGTAAIAFCFSGALSLFPLLAARKNELIERNEYLQKTSLVHERDEERQKREQTERMLHILSQAIGGIVHDLGNPLTAVQGGADTLLYFVKQGKPDKELVQEFAAMITDGAQMLNYLRLSLMEQTRVLEGKPIPVEAAPASIHGMVKAGAHYQKPRFSAGRTVSFEGEDLEVCVDGMRFITVFMNLIGNALKYSDGEVRITWSQQGEHILIAVQDQGLHGQGITQSQAQKLFVAFGRLDTHAQIEGTGLGLLSVQKIAEAHDGEVYIEGHTDGTLDSPKFTTSQNTHPSVLDEEFLTAFVTSCPLKVLSHQQQVSEHYAPQTEETKNP